MMRKTIVAGNWKMNKDYSEGIALAGEIAAMIKKGFVTRSGIVPEVVLAPPFYLLKVVSDITTGIPGMEVAAQNASAYQSGAYTGEVSASMIRSAGASYAIIGHSERRTIFGETDEILKQKADRVLVAGLSLIFCVGEILQERIDGRHFEVVEQQLKNGVFHLDSLSFSRVVIAYEPVWAIGTGHNATPLQVEEMHSYIRELILKQFGYSFAITTPIIYGGSCKPQNAAEIFSMSNVDGGLIGGASLVASDFIDIITSV